MHLSFLKGLFIYLKEHYTERDNKIFHALVYSSKWLQHPCLTKMKSGSKNSIQISHMGSRGPSIWIILVAFSDALRGSWIRSRTSGTQSSTLIFTIQWCQYYKEQLSPSPILKLFDLWESSTTHLPHLLPYEVCHQKAAKWDFPSLLSLSNSVNTYIPSTMCWFCGWKMPLDAQAPIEMDGPPLEAQVFRDSIIPGKVTTVGTRPMVMHPGIFWVS